MARIVRFHEVGGPEVSRIEEVGKLSAGQLKPKIAKTFRFDAVADAYRYMESSQQIGKIVLTLGD
jgi:NADPH:quinone reductase-like Zn-dependent oxidoreductase